MQILLFRTQGEGIIIIKLVLHDVLENDFTQNIDRRPDD